jgi:pSer/pThr/pTyr-binding forkhead associated (FHA) protein
VTKGAGIDPLSAGVAEDANDPDRTAAPKSSPRNLRLVVAGGPSPLAIELAAPGVWTFGRADDVDVKIDDPSISRHHARLIVELDRSHVPQLFIEDLGSSNGTSVRGRRIERGAHGAVAG